MPETYITTAEVARRLGVNRNTVKAWLASGRLRGTKPGGDRMGWRIREDDLAAFMEQGRPGPGRPPKEVAL